MLKKTLKDNAGSDAANQMETVATYPTIVEADLIREELISAGVEAWIANATIAQTFITMPDTGVTVEVRAEDVAHALEIISAAGTAPPITDEEMNAAIDASIAEANPDV